MAKDISAQMRDILAKYVKEVETDVEDAAQEAADYTTNELKSTSPSGKGKAKYRSGWTCRRMSHGMITRFVIYNRNAPGLTHLLEKGHVVKNQYGTYGRARAIPHIEATEQRGLEKFEQAIRMKIGR